MNPTTAHFAAIGDYGYDGQPEADVAALVNSWNPEFIITLGDNNYDSGAASTIDANIGKYYHSYIGNYTGSYGAGSATNRFFPALGNHDWYSATGSPSLPMPYLNFFTLPGNERYYTITQGPVQFFVVDSALGDAANPTEPDGIISTSTQAQWLQSQLAASTAAWKLVYFHHAPYSSSAHGNNTAMQWPFQAWGATAVLAGHDHSYERIDVGGLPYFVNGLGGRSLYDFNSPVAGSQLRYNSDFGAMLIDASDTRLQFQFFTVAGVLIDSYSIDKTVPLPVVSVATGDVTLAEPSDPGTFILTRTGSTLNSLTVNYALGGAATGGIDFTVPSGSVTFAPGSATASVNITPLDDWLVEGSETVELSIMPSSAYNMAAAYSGTLTLGDNEVVDTPLVPSGSTWKYRDDGSNQGTAWKEPSFVDSSWASGAAELGYGDGGEATTVSFGPNPNNKYVTTYFRKSFTVNNVIDLQSLAMRLLRDDGAVVYLNGNEVYRSNMPGGAVTYSTLASSAISGVEESTFVSVDLSPAMLVDGTNVIAVEIHQSAVDSSDISFDLELRADIVQSFPPPTVQSVLTNGTTAGQHSRVTSIVVNFSEPVVIANPGSTFQLTRISGGSPGSIGLTTAQAGSSVSVTFNSSGSLALDPGDSLPNGRFQLTISALGIVGLGNYLDGNANGVYSPSDPNTDNHVSTTWRLFGDADGDGTVTLQDFAAFRSAFGTGPSFVFDFDQDGDVDLTDFAAFRSYFGMSV